jgi:aminopeptidase N
MVRALGQFRHDEAAADAVLAVLARDASYFVEAEAATALAKTRSLRAFPALVEARERRSFLDVVRAACFGGMAELRDERGLDFVIEGAAYGQPSTARRAAIAAMGALGALFPSRKAAVRERLVELLEDPDFRARIAAVEALRALGDAAAVGALKKAEREDLDGRVRRRAREVAKALAEGAPHEEAMRTLRESVEKLEGENRELKERLSKLEAARKPPEVAK